MSALNLNKVLLCGRLTADIELKKTPSGHDVISFTLAINRPRGKDDKQTADFINCVAWDKTAEFIAKYFKKGDSLYIGGAIRTRNYSKDGRTVYITEVVVKEARFVDHKAAAPAYNEPEYTEFEEINTDGDLPF